MLARKCVQVHVYRPTSISYIAAPRLGNGVQLVKEEDTRSSSPGLVKHIPHVSFTLTKPHGQ